MFKPFDPSLLSKPPEFLELPSLVSPAYVRPSSFHVTERPAAKAYMFSGEEFISQFGIQTNEYGEALRNMCGSMTYRGKVEHTDAYEHLFYDGLDVPLYHQVELWDYVFETVDEVSSVKVKRIAFSKTGTGIPGDCNISYQSIDKAIIYDYWYDPKKPRDVRGYIRMSAPVEKSYLGEKLSAWLAQSEDFRNQTGSFSDGGATSSETEAGADCQVSGFVLWVPGQNLKPDIVDGAVTTQYGYDAPFTARVPMVKRKNGPVIRDLDDFDSVNWEAGLSVFRSGKEGKELRGVIQNNKWADEFGTYASGDLAALASIGYCYDGLYRILRTPAEDLYSQHGVAMFLSNDGKSYRLTLSAKSVDGNTVLSTDVVMIAPTVPAYFSYPSRIDGAGIVVVSALDVLTDNGYQSVTLPAGDGSPVIAHRPDIAGCRVIYAVKFRYGARWGFPKYGIETYNPNADKENEVRYQVETHYIDRKIKDSDAASPGKFTSQRVQGSSGTQAPRIPQSSPSVAQNPGSVRSSSQIQSSGRLGQSSALSSGHSNGTPLTSGGTRGTPLTSGHSNGKPLSSGHSNGTALTSGGTNGTPLAGSGAGNGTALTSGGTRGTPLTSGGAGIGKPLGSGSNGSPFGSGAPVNQRTLQGSTGVESSGGVKSPPGLESSSGTQSAVGLQPSRGLGNTQLLQSSASLQTGSLEASGNLRPSSLQVSDGLRVGSVQSSGNLRPSSLQGSGGLRSGSSGGSLRSSGGALSGGSKGGSKKAGSGRPSRVKPVFQRITCGHAVSGQFVFVSERSYHAGTGKISDPKVLELRANVNGKDCTPDREKASVFIPIYFGGSPITTQTKVEKKYTGTWSDNCVVHFDWPDRYGKVVSSSWSDFTVPNGGTIVTPDPEFPEETALVLTPSDEKTVSNPNPGTTLFAEHLVFLP